MRNKNWADKAFDIFNYSFVTIMVVLIAYPLIYIISSSFSSTDAVMSGKVWLYPVDFSLEGYKTIFNYSLIWTGYLNTIVYTVAGTFINVVMTILAAYPLSRKDMYGRHAYMMLVTITMFFSGGLIPNYLLVSNLNMIDKRISMLIPGAISVWNVIITRTYYQNNIPDELLEAARLDGCNDFKFIWHVVIPLSGAITAVNVLFYAVGHWNEYFNAMLYLNDERLFPLQIILRQILILNSITGKLVVRASSYSSRVGLAELLKYSLIVVASVPVIIIYPFVQKFFVKGIMVGSLKG